MANPDKIRVFQVATGNLGTETIGRIQRHPDLELVGLHCYSPEKIGRDAGEIVGIDPVRVTATGTVEEIIAVAPDVLTFHGVFPDEDLYVKVLEAGINIVTTADWITGYHRDTNHPHPSGRKVSELIAEACERGGSTFYGSGMNPGLNQILGIVHTADVAEIEHIRSPNRSMCPATIRWTPGRRSATAGPSTTRPSPIRCTSTPRCSPTRCT